MHSVDKILAFNKVSQLFPNNNLAEIKNIYRQYARKYHPDISGDAMSTQVFAVINFLYEKALSYVETNTWEKLPIFEFKENGKTRKFRYIYSNPIESGMEYICSDCVIYELNKGFNYNIPSINNAKFKAEFEKYHPEIYVKVKDGDKQIVVLKTAKECYKLADVKEYFKTIDPKHVCWIMSRLLNYACFLYVEGYVHNALTLNNVYVLPETHTIKIVGGWQFCNKIGAKMKNCPRDVYDSMPYTVKMSKLADTITDLASIRHMAKVLKCPTDFLSKPLSENSIDEFKKWDKSLLDCYGKRHFQIMEVDELYKKIGKGE